VTADELRSQFNNEFGLGNWPKQYEVDAITYANCCQEIFDLKPPHILLDDYKVTEVMLGYNNGLLFKGVELILMGRKI